MNYEARLLMRKNSFTRKHLAEMLGISEGSVGLALNCKLTNKSKTFRALNTYFGKYGIKLEAAPQGLAPRKQYEYKRLIKFASDVDVALLNKTLINLGRSNQNASNPY